jgi:predicted MFS family arabinose efflux permease
LSDGRHVSEKAAVIVGLSSLAAAMGIGRFAFTPIFPLMQEALGVTLAEGARLASANHVGYLLGACASFLLTPSCSRASSRNEQARWPSRRLA